MVQILRHELKKQGNETVLFLYLDQSNTEFARELGSLDDNTKGDLDKSVNSYIRSKLPNLKQATVKIMVGGLLVTSFAFSPAVGGLFGGDNDNRAHAAEVDVEYKGFPDVSPDRESAPAIEALVKAGVIKGYPDGFHPREEISRQHAAVMFVRALKLPTDNVTDPGFKDVPATHPYYKEIAAATAAGFFNKGDNFNPTNNFTRGQSASVIVRAYDLKGDTTTPFTDLAGSGHEEAIGIMYNLGLAKGTGDTFKPGNNVTREQFAMLLHRTIEADVDEVVVAPPTVASVSEITRTGVTVILPTATEAKEGYTIEVKDPSGAVIPVKPINIEIGDAEVTFDFATALSADPASGVWSVGGKDFDQATVYAVDAVKDALAPGTVGAVNQVNLLKALKSPYFSGVNDSLINVYTTNLYTAKANLDTVANIQKVIDDTNTANVTATQATAVLKDIKDARAVSEVAFYNALSSKFSRVNSDWIKDYTLAGVNFDATGEAAVTEYKEIQPAIDTANNLRVVTAVTAASTSLDATVISNAKSLLDTYYTDPTPTDKTDEKAALAKKLDIQTEVIGVRTANTNAKLQNALTKLDAVVNDKTVFDVSAVNPNELSRYRTAMTDAQNSVTAIKTLITTQNGLAEAAVVTDIKNITKSGDPAVYSVTNDQFKSLLEKLADRSKFVDPTTPAFSMNVVIDSMIGDYLETLGAVENTDDLNAAGVNSAIVGINNPVDSLTNINGAPVDADADALLVLLKAKDLNLKNLVDANKEHYLTDVAAIKASAAIASDANAATQAAALNELTSTIDAINAKVELNSATSAAAAKDALTKLAIAEGDLTDYINLSTTVKTEVADLVLAAKPTTGYTDVAAVKTAVGSSSSGQIQAHANLVAGVNDTYGGTITEVNTALKALNYDAYKNLTASKQLDVAEAFLQGFPTNTTTAGTVKVEYKTLSGIKADIDKAITAVR
jgi:hypothetical protein